MLTTTAMAAQIQVSERTLAKMVDEGCPFMLAGKRRRFDPAAVSAWMQERACQSVKTPAPAYGMHLPASATDAYTASYRRAQLRVMPSA